MIEVKFKRLSDKAILPIRAHEGDAGVDLTATQLTTELNECGQISIVYHTDLAVEIPAGYVGLLFPRSSISNKSLAFTNSVGVIDSGYRGEIMAKLRATTDVVPAVYKVGERFAQLVIVPIAEYTITEATELSNTDRGEDGYGSSDNKEISAVTGTDSEPSNTSEQSAPEQAADPTNGSETAE